MLWAFKILKSKSIKKNNNFNKSFYCFGYESFKIIDLFSDLFVKKLNLIYISVFQRLFFIGYFMSLDNESKSKEDSNLDENKHSKDSDNPSSSTHHPSPFRKDVQDRLSSPEQLDQLLHVVRPKGWVALIGVIIFLAALVTWSIFGSIPIEVVGRGIILTENGLFGITAIQEGIVTSIPVKIGQWVEQDDVIAVLDSNGVQKTLKAAQKGKIVEIDIAIGDYVNMNTLIGYGQYPLEKGQTLICHAYFSILDGEKIKMGMEGKINVENIDKSIWGYLLGNVSYIAEYPASDKELFDMLRNPELINYIKQGSSSVINVQLTPVVNVLTDSGYAWTTPTGPHQYVKAGSICEVRIITNQRTPLSYIFPMFYQKNTPSLGNNPNIFPENVDGKS